MLVYNAIAEHFKCVFKKTFDVFGYEYGLFVEDDLGFAIDFFHYFEGAKELLKRRKGDVSVTQGGAI